MKTTTVAGVGPHKFRVGQGYNFQVSVASMDAGDTAQVSVFPTGQETAVVFESGISVEDLVVFEAGHADSVTVEKTGGGAFAAAGTEVTFSLWRRPV